MLLLSVLLHFVPEPSEQQQCRSNSDVGGTECVLLTPYYSQYQWATCLTEDYIIRRSNQMHVCRGRVAICWYQCMLEFYNMEQGLVNNGCRCSPGNTTTEAPTDNLPPHCYSPRGEDCSWYRECLERRYQCEGTDHGYAIEYADKFCNLFSNNYNDFSANGRAWVDGVRKCLQVALVPSLRPWVMKTCEDIRRDAFKSHPPCYLTPGSGAPGICELWCLDVWRAFWLVNFEGGALSSAPIETGRQMLSVMAGCFNWGPFSGCIPAAQTALLIVVPGPRLSVLAGSKVVNYIATGQNWIENGFRWFPFLNDNDEDDNLDMGNRNKRQTTDEYTNINVLLVDTKVLNISNGTISTPTPGNIDLDQAVENLANAVGDGLLSEIPIVLNGTEMNLEVFSVGQCTDILCNSTNVTELATAPPPSPTSGANTALFVQLHSMAVICVIQYLFFFLIMWNFDQGLLTRL